MNEKMRKKIFRQLCAEEGLPEPQAEYMFAKHIGRKWRADYYFERDGIKVALEVEGGVWTRGRHTRASGYIKDMEKYNAMSRLGIYLLRCTPDKLIKVETIRMVREVLNLKTTQK